MRMKNNWQGKKMQNNKASQNKSALEAAKQKKMDVQEESKRSEQMIKISKENGCMYYECDSKAGAMVSKRQRRKKQNEFLSIFHSKRKL